MFPHKLFWSIITIYLILGIYLFITSIQSPIAGIEVEKSNDKWEISNFEYPELANLHHINQGDFLLKVNDQDITKFNSLDYDQTIRSANSLTIMTKEGDIRDVLLSHYDLPFQFLAYFILPLCYFFIVLFIAAYLFKNKKGNSQSLKYLILFMLSLALAYSSIASSTRLDRIGIVVNSTSMILSAVLLLQFIKFYLMFIDIKFKVLNKSSWFYLFPIIVFILTILEGPFPFLFSVNTLIILSIFFILLTMIIIILGISQVNYKKPHIKLLLWGFILPFLPFLFLFVLPVLIFQEFIISSTASALFLLLIPIGFIFAQLSERLFDVEYHISRLRYYTFYSLILTIWLILGISLLTSVSFNKLVDTALFIFISLVISFYIKEKIDYHNRKVLFSPRGDYIHLLYTTIDEIGNAIKTEEVFQRLSSIISKQFELDIVYVVAYDVQEKRFLPTQDNNVAIIHKSLNQSIFDNLQLREIKKYDSYYVACLHHDIELKHFLVMGNNNNTQLKHEELLWLELLILFVNSFIDSSKLVEDLLEQLTLAQQKGTDQPIWLKKLVWLQLEDEKNQLAQELHDTVLQEQIFLIREMDSILYETDIEKMQPKIADFHRQLVTINHQLRSYCEKLKPPLLDTLGLNAALNKLIMETKKRAAFSLITSLEQVNVENKQIPLLIYRIIQEMLSNAVKHSEATYVKIQLKNYNNGFEIFYMDNGVGCDMDTINQSDSMGLTGMRERVLAYGGYIDIDTYPNEGMQIHIQVGNDLKND